MQFRRRAFGTEFSVRYFRPDLMIPQLENPNTDSPTLFKASITIKSNSSLSYKSVEWISKSDLTCLIGPPIGSPPVP
jgi:hypothetical protein